VRRNFDFSRFAPESEIAVVLELSKNNKKKGNTPFSKNLKKRGTPFFSKLVFSGFGKGGVQVLNKTNEDGCFVFFLKSSIAIVLEFLKNDKRNTPFSKNLKKRGTPLFPKLVFSGFEIRGVQVLNKTNEDGCFIFFLKSSRWVFHFLSEIFKMGVSFSF